MQFVVVASGRDVSPRRPRTPNRTLIIGADVPEVRPYHRSGTSIFMGRLSEPSAEDAEVVPHFRNPEVSATYGSPELTTRICSLKSDA